MKKLVNIFLLLTLPLCIIAQTTELTEPDLGRINEEPSIRRMLDHRKALNFDQKRKIKAWSVQIYITRDKYLANKKIAEIKNDFVNKDQNVDWFYANPYYRLYTGTFYTKIEAISLLNELIEEYPDAYIFKNNEAQPTDML